MVPHRFQAEFLKTDTLDKFNVDVAVINGHPLDPEPAALSEEALQVRRH